jgi:hypothetical protein
LEVDLKREITLTKEKIIKRMRIVLEKLIYHEL